MNEYRVQVQYPSATQRHSPFIINLGMTDNQLGLWHTIPARDWRAPSTSQSAFDWPKEKHDRTGHVRPVKSVLRGGERRQRVIKAPTKKPVTIHEAVSAKADDPRARLVSRSGIEGT